MFRTAHCVAGVALAAMLAMPADAELLSRKDLSLEIALAIASTAGATCKAQGHRVSVTVVGRSGEILVALRGDNTSPHTMENSQRKAYTSRTFRVPSGEFAKRVLKPGEPPGGQVHLSGIIALASALPIKLGEEVIGAVGVSGSMTTPGAPGGEKDEACAKAGIDKVATLLN